MYDKCYFCLDQLPKLKKESTASFFVNFGGAGVQKSRPTLLYFSKAGTPKKMNWEMARARVKVIFAAGTILVMLAATIFEDFTSDPVDLFLNEATFMMTFPLHCIGDFLDPRLPTNACHGK